MISERRQFLKEEKGSTFDLGGVELKRQPRAETVESRKSIGGFVYKFMVRRCMGTEKSGVRDGSGLTGGLGSTRSYQLRNLWRRRREARVKEKTARQRLLAEG